MIKNFIENKNVIGVFSDPAGAKSVLAYLSIFKNSAKKITTFTNKINRNYDQFDLKINYITENFSGNLLDEADILITGTSYPLNIELKFIKLAKSKNIFSLSIVDHWTNLKKRFSERDKVFFPDIITVIDKEAEKAALIDGIPENIIHILENPYYHFLANWKPKIDRKEFFEKLNINYNNNYLLYSPEPFIKFELNKKYGFDEIDGLKMIIKSLSNLKSNKILIIKSHPNDDTLKLKKFIESLENPKLLFLKDFDMNHLIYYSKANIGFFSNSMIESSLLGVKTIRLLTLLKNLELDPLKHLKFKFNNVYSVNELSKNLS